MTPCLHIALRKLADPFNPRHDLYRCEECGDLLKIMITDASEAAAQQASDEYEAALTDAIDKVQAEAAAQPTWEDTDTNKALESIGIAPEIEHNDH